MQTFLLRCNTSEMKVVSRYCLTRSMSRTDFFRRLLNRWLIRNKKLIAKMPEVIEQGIKDVESDLKDSRIFFTSFNHKKYAEKNSKC